MSHMRDDRQRHGEPDEQRPENGSLRLPSALPSPSRLPHVTLSGGLLSGFDVLRVEDTSWMAPEKVERGARVELYDGTHARVVKARRQHLSKLGIEGSVDLELPDGTLVSKPNRDIARVLTAAGRD